MKKVIIFGFILAIALLGIFAFQHAKFYDGKLHVVFCDVGQGDAIFIRTPKGLDIIVDGGPDNKVLSCLAEHMPFWDRDLELVILTHPHADHLNGLIGAFDRYKVKSFATEMVKNNTDGFSRLMEQVKNENVNTRYVYAGDKFRFKDGVVLKIAGPSTEYIQATSPNGTIGERSEFASVLSLIEYKEFQVLLTGDSQGSGLKEAINDGQIGDIDVLQVPHHGSRTGLSFEILDTLRPELAAISVGKNSYGHPTTETLEILREKDIKILRTDQIGDIEIVSNGESWVGKN